MIYFLSDLHLGSLAFENKIAHQNKVIKLLEHMGHDASAIYLLGDVFDFWHEYFWRDRSKKTFEPLFRTIRHLVKRGVKVHFFTGNHDMWTYGELQKLTGMIMHYSPCTVTLKNKSIYLAHGDGLLPTNIDKLYPTEVQKKIRSFIRLRAFFYNPIPRFMYRCMPPFLGNALGYNWAKHSRLKELANPLAYKGEDKEELILFAKEMEQTYHHDYYIFGHRHIDLDLQISPTSRVIILGDCFKLFTYAQMDHEGNIEMKTV